MKKDKIPNTDSISELARFFDAHDFTDYEDEMVRVKGPLFSCAKRVSVQLAPKEASFVKKVAKSKGVKESEVIQAWIREKMKA